MHSEGKLHHICRQQQQQQHKKQYANLELILLS